MQIFSRSAQRPFIKGRGIATKKNFFIFEKISAAETRCLVKMGLSSIKKVLRNFTCLNPFFSTKLLPLMRRQLFSKKSIDQLRADAESAHGLHRTLGPVQLFAMGVGAIIGAGIFVLTGLAAREHAGPALTLSFVVAGFGCTFAALCYAEFAAMVPVAGSAYTYAYATLGELFAWIIGWDLILEYAMASSAVAVGWSKYFVEFVSLFGIHLSPRFFMDPQSYLTSFGGPALTQAGLWESLRLTFTGQVPFSCDIVAVGILLIVTAILVKGIRESARVNTAIVFLKLFVVLYVIFAGSKYVDVSNWHPYFPFGWKGVMTGASFIFFAYIGFDSVSTHAEEAKNPQRDVPLGILLSLAFCTILYIAVAAVLTGMVKFSEIDIHAPIASAFAVHGIKSAVLLVSFGALAGLTSVLLVMMLSQARVFLAMARDHLLPYEFFGKIHPRFRTPHYSTMLTGFVVALVAGFTPIGKIAELVNIGTLLAFAIVCAAVLVLRAKDPGRHRPFRCPWVPVVPILGIVSNVVLMLSLDNITKLRLVIWLAIGFLIYFTYSRKKSEFYVSK